MMVESTVMCPRCPGTGTEETARARYERMRVYPA